MAKTRNGLIAALDVGSSKICCFIADAQGEAAPKVVGIGQQISHGVRAGAVVDMARAENAILNAVHAAEQMAGETIGRVVVNLTGGYPASSTIGVEIALNGHEISDSDLRRALEQGYQVQTLEQENGSDRQLIHSIPTGFSIDGSRGIRDPRGMFGDHLGVSMHLVTAGAGAVRNLSTCVQRCHLDIAGLAVSPYASGLAVLVEDEMDLGVTVIDMGGGTTGIAVFREGKAIFTDVIGVGGNHVTNDIARGLSTAVVHAERLKTLYGHAMANSADDHAMIDVPQIGEEDEEPAHRVPRSLLVSIIQPRLEETFELVRSRLEASGMDRLGGRRVVLTGGASELPGLRDLAALILDRQVRIGRPLRIRGLAEATAGPAYATCSGLLHYALGEEIDWPVQVTAGARKGWPGSPALSMGSGKDGGLMGRVGEWLREHF